MALAAWAALMGVAAVLAYVWFRVAFRERLYLASKLPSPTYYPLIGHLYFLSSNVNEFFNRMVGLAVKCPEKVCMLRWMHRVAVAVWNPTDVEFLLSSHEYLEKSQDYRFFKPWLGNGLLISSGETWRSHRRLIAPTFHLNVLKQFIHLFNRNGEVLVQRLRAVQGQEVDVHDFMSETTVEVLLETAMGVDRTTQKSGYEYAMAVMKMCTILHLRHFRPWLWPDALFQRSSKGRSQRKLLSVIHNLTQEVVRKRRAERKMGLREGLYKRLGVEAKEAPRGALSSTSDNTDISFGQAAGLKDDLDDVGEKRRIAFLDQMLETAEDSVALSHQEVEDQVNTIMFEGHDTTAAASSFFLALMGIHQDIQARCVNELQEIFGDSDRPASFQDTLEMKYLERCIMETLRLFPPVPVIARHLNKNVRLPSGFVIPEGTTVILPQFMLHRDPEIYPNPTEYNPDNFLPERCADRHYYAFIPFSAGPRSCVGRKYAMLKLKILLSAVLRQFRVEADIKESDFQLMGDIILKRKEGFPVRLHPRKKLATTLPGVS